jgi:hypothetical protein
MRRYNYNKESNQPNSIDAYIKKPEKFEKLIKKPTPAPVQIKTIPKENNFMGKESLKKKDLDEVEVITRIPSSKVIKNKPNYDEKECKDWWENNGKPNNNILSEFCMKYICSLELANFDSLEWISRIPVYDSFDSQLETLHVLVNYLETLDFPKKQDSFLIIEIFKTFLAKGIIEDEVFVEWYESKDIKKRAMIQTSEWILQLMEKMNETNEDEEVPDMDF